MTYGAGLGLLLPVEPDSHCNLRKGSPHETAPFGAAIKSFRIERTESVRHALDQARPVRPLASLGTSLGEDR